MRKAGRLLTTQWTLRGGALLLATVLFMAATCHRPPVRQLSECPQSWQGFRVVLDTIGRGAGLAEYVITELTLPGRATNVPEFHDCQRFIEVLSAGRMRYDSLYAIFASSDLPRLRQKLDSLYELPVRNPPGTMPQQAIGLPAAEILSLGGSYPALGIRPGFNCLYFYRDSAEMQNGKPLLKAKMHPVGVNEKNCAEPVNALEVDGKVLIVNEDAPQGFRESDYPPVARWDWDRVHHKQYIGIKCGAAWCEVGDTGFVASPTHDRPGLEPAQRRVYRIKGWYDEQFLAERIGSETVPTPTWGRIVPHHDLGSLNLATFEGESVHVATVIMPDNVGSYPEKMNYTTGENRLYLCRGTAAGCGVPDNVKSNAAAMINKTAKDLPENHLFWAMIHSANGNWTHRYVTRMDHTGLEASTGIVIPGTARWRWILADETNWVRCDEGCCHPHY